MTPSAHRPAQIRAALLAVFVSVLTACGGGGGSSTPASPPVTLQSIAITPNTPSVSAGFTQQFEATGTYSDDTTANLTSKVSWSSASPSVGTVDSTSGLAKAVAMGTTVITATSGSVSGSATLKVTPPKLQSIAITPKPVPFASAIVATAGSETQLKATGTYSDGTSRDVTTTATWAADTPSVAIVGLTTGVTTAVSAGFCKISVTIGSVTSTAPLWIVTNVLPIVPQNSRFELVYAPILAISRPSVVYKFADGSTHLYSGSSDTMLPIGTIQNLGNWAVTNGGYVFADGFGNDRPGGGTSIYMWSPGATAATNLSISAGSQSMYDQLLAVHYPWVLWASLISVATSWSQYTLYNVSTGQNLTVTEPAGATYIGNNQCDFATINGQLNLFYWASSPGADGTTNSNVYSWNQSANASTQISNDNVSIYPQTDGTWVAWQSGLTHALPTPPLTLSLRNIALGTTKVLSTNMVQFELTSGLVGWLDQTITTKNATSTVTAQAIRASDGTSTTSISTLLDASFVGSSGGYVVYEENTNVYAWSAAGGRRLLYGGSSGSGVILSGKVVYFSFAEPADTSQTVYAMTLP